MLKIKNNPLQEDLDHILDHTSDLWEELRNKKYLLPEAQVFLGAGYWKV